MNNGSSVQMLKLVTSIFFIIVIVALLGTTFTTILGLATGTIGYLTTGSLFIFLQEIMSTLGYFLDTLFISNFTSYTYAFAPNITITSLNFVLSFFRVLLGCGIICIIFSLLFGQKG